MLMPLGESRPTTVKGAFLTRMIWPTGSTSPKRVLAVVWPMRATLAALRTSCSVKFAPRRNGPGANVDVVGAHAEDLGVEVLVAGGELGEGADLGAGAGDVGHFVANGLVILPGQGAGAAEAHAEAAAADVAGEDQDDVLAEGGDLGFDLGLGAIADADHGDDRADADDDAEHGQERAQRVAAQGAGGDSESGEEDHGANWTACCSQVEFAAAPPER